MYAAFAKICMTKTVLHSVQYGLLRAIACLPQCSLHSIARCIAFIAWHGRSRLRRITEINIRHCRDDLSAKQQQQLARQSLIETVKVGLEMPRVLFHSCERNLSLIAKVSGKAHIDALLAAGHGVIVLAPHLGNWEYLGLYLGQHFDCVSLYKPSGHPVMDRLVEQARSGSGAKLMPTNKKGVMAVVKHLRQAGVTGILPDQVPDDRNAWISADFYGQPAPTMSLVANLAKKPQIKAVGAFAQRLENGQFEIIFQAVDDALYSKDSHIAATAMNHAVEQLIACAPAQYQWEYKRFKWTADGAKHPIYKQDKPSCA